MDRFLLDSSQLQNSAQSVIPRYAPQHSLPSYSYVSGMHPRPADDDLGCDIQPLMVDKWSDCACYLYGMDLFNHGFYWESHESWEILWIAANRQGSTADFLKALIKLAAAAVKAREGRPNGVVKHARNAVSLLESLQPSGSNVFCGISLRQLISDASNVAENAETLLDDTVAKVKIVMPFTIQLQGPR